MPLTDLVNQLETVRRFLDGFNSLLQTGTESFVIDSSGMLASLHYYVPLKTTDSIFEAAGVVIKEENLVVEFERTPFGDYFGIYYRCETQEEADKRATELGTQSRKKK